MSEKEIYITITEADLCYSLDELSVGETVTLIKEPNRYDDETIKVMNEEGCQYGYVANSVSSVAKGTHSAGYIYNFFEDETKCDIMFILGSKAIGCLKKTN